jgi:hypothetical protein
VSPGHDHIRPLLGVGNQASDASLGRLSNTYLTKVMKDGHGLRELHQQHADQHGGDPTGVQPCDGGMLVTPALALGRWLGARLAATRPSPQRPR